MLTFLVCSQIPRRQVQGTTAQRARNQQQQHASRKRAPLCPEAHKILDKEPVVGWGHREGKGCVYVAERDDRDGQWKIGESAEYPPERRMKEIKCTVFESYPTNFRLKMENMMKAELQNFKLPGKVPQENGGSEWYGKGLKSDLIDARAKLCKKEIEYQWG
ncbi:unnamed protein product [Ectocarpus sp. CCAP 1310/34]|nr:unnamed protein product [Ectocarpus sp. CCAP 1310/34]